MRFIVLLVAIACILALFSASVTAQRYRKPRVVKRRDYTLAEKNPIFAYDRTRGGRKRYLVHRPSEDNVEDFSYEKTGTKFWDFIGEAKKTYNMIKKSQKESTEALFSDKVQDEELEYYSFNKNGLNFWQMIEELQTAKKMYDDINKKNKKEETAVVTPSSDESIKEYTFDKQGLKFWEVVDELKKAKKIYDIILNNNNNVEAGDYDGVTFERRGTKFFDFIDELKNAYDVIKKTTTATTAADAEQQKDIREYTFDKGGLGFWGVIDELKKAKDAYDAINKKDDAVVAEDEIKEYTFDKKGLNFKQVIDELKKAKKAYEIINNKSE